MTRAMFVIVALVVGGVVSAGHSVADEAPISGTVKAIDASAKTLTLQTTSKGRTRDVIIVLKPETKIVKFVRPTEPGKTGFVEQPLALSDVKPGWIVSITTKHEGGNEVAEIVPWHNAKTTRSAFLRKRYSPASRRRRGRLSKGDECRALEREERKR